LNSLCVFSTNDKLFLIIFSNNEGFGVTNCVKTLLPVGLFKLAIAPRSRNWKVLPDRGSPTWTIRKGGLITVSAKSPTVGFICNTSVVPIFFSFPVFCFGSISIVSADLTEGTEISIVVSRGPLWNENPSTTMRKIMAPIFPTCFQNIFDNKFFCSDLCIDIIVIFKYQLDLLYCFASHELLKENRHLLIIERASTTTVCFGFS